MTLLDRYINGETEKVYEEIYSLGAAALSKDHFPKIHPVLTETFTRVAYNLDFIYEELKKINYCFATHIQYDWQRPRLAPDPNTETLLLEVNQKVSSCGHLPLSLEYFYRIVGSCNFCWDWETVPEIPWEGADPLDIPPLKNLLEVVYDDYDNEDILLAGDYLQKDNVSGSCYNIELTSSPAVDSLLLHEDWDIPFINYLRITMTNCGFSMADRCDYPDLDEFCNRVRPKLRLI